MKLEKIKYVHWNYKNPYRPFCDLWWWHILKLGKYLFRDLRSAIQRAKRGYADSDTYDMMSYHTGLTLGMLEEFKKRHNGFPYGMTEVEYEIKLIHAIDGWKALQERQHDTGWDYEHDQDYYEWSEPLQERADRGLKIFNEIYNSLWM